MTSPAQKDNALLEKSFLFSVKIVNFGRCLMEEKKEFIISKQIIRSATSIGANAEEANGAISQNDFSAKISIAYKEAKETHYWLRILKETKYASIEVLDSLLKDCDELLRITYAILKKTRINKGK